MPGIENLAPERHRHQQWIVGIAELLAGLLLDALQGASIVCCHNPLGNWPPAA